MSLYVAKDTRGWTKEDEAERQAIIRRTYHNRLLFQKGPERALAIIEGRDEAFNADLAAWRSLGVRK
jgi:hypothetical protein